MAGYSKTAEGKIASSGYVVSGLSRNHNSKAKKGRIYFGRVDVHFFHCCISQGVYLCTGSHRWDKETFDLETRPIVIEDGFWVGAMARVGPPGDD